MSGYFGISDGTIHSVFQTRVAETHCHLKDFRDPSLDSPYAGDTLSVHVDGLTMEHRYARFESYSLRHLYIGTMLQSLLIC